MNTQTESEIIAVFSSYEKLREKSEENYDLEKKAYYNIKENNNELHSGLFPDLIINMKEVFEED